MSYYHPQHFPPVLNNHYGISVKSKRNKKRSQAQHNRRLVMITSVAITLPFAIAIAGSYLVKYSSPSTKSSNIDRKSSSSYLHSHPELTHPTAPHNTPPSDPLHVPGPEVVWLVNYPASRAAFIRKIIHDVSRTTTATNYLREVRLDNTNLDEVPYRFRNDMTLPTKYLLTETHCAGYGLNGVHDHTITPPPIVDTHHPVDDNNTPRGAMFVRSPHDFYTGCATGETAANRRGVLLYPPDLARKVVHLVRHPLDNIVQRYYSAGHETRLSNDVWRYGESPAGFKRWCRYVDGSTRYKMMLPTDLFGRVRDVVPCYVLLHQYVMFHNNAWDMATKVDRRLEYSVAHVDDYEYFAEAFIYKLFQFLDLDIKGEPPALTLLKYTDFWSEEERVAVASYIKVLAAEEIWNELKRYLPAPSLEGALKPLGEVLSPVHHGTWPKRVSWLMALPSAGGGDLGRRVEFLTGTTTAVNDATGFDVTMRPNVAFSDNGPYRASSRPFPKLAAPIMTAATCYNNTIPGDDYMVKSFEEFYADCSVTRHYDTHGKLTQMRYNPRPTVSKIVHLVRNPFDNMVSQFQAEASSQAEVRFPFTSDADGFWSWCDKKNEEFSYWHQSDGDNNLSKKVPCYALLYRYIQWHNYAFEVAEELEVKQLVFYYEDLVTEREEKMDELLKFLDLTKLKHDDDEYDEGIGMLTSGDGSGGVGYDDGTKQQQHHHHASSALTGPYKGILDSLTDANYAATVEYINLIGSIKTNQVLERYLTPI